MLVSILGSHRLIWRPREPLDTCLYLCISTASASQSHSPIPRSVTAPVARRPQAERRHLSEVILVALLQEEEKEYSSEGSRQWLKHFVFGEKKMKAHTETVTSHLVRHFTYHNRNLRYSGTKSGTSPLTRVLKMAFAFSFTVSTDCKTGALP